MAKLIYDSVPGVVRRVIHVDASAPAGFTQETIQAFPDDLAARNRAKAELISRNPYAGVRVLASGVPVAVYERSVREEWDEADWNKWLEDPDNAAFRVSREKL